MFSKNVLKIVPMRVCKFSFLNTSNTYRVFGNYFRPRWKPLVDACVGDSRRLLSEVFERKADYFMFTASSERNFSLIASRKEKNTRNTVKITFSCGNYNIFTFFSCCLPETRTKDHRKRSPFFEFQAKYLSGTWNFKIIERNIKAIFRVYFSSLREDSGKMFKLMTFRRGPRTTYCICYPFYVLDVR